MLSTLNPSKCSFAPDAMSATEALKTSDRPEPSNLGSIVERNRITQAPADFFQIHPRTHEVTKGLVCRTHVVWHTNAEGEHVECEHCDRAIAKRIAKRAERMGQHIRSVAKTGRFGVSR